MGSGLVYANTDRLSIAMLDVARRYPASFIHHRVGENVDHLKRQILHIYLHILRRVSIEVSN